MIVTSAYMKYNMDLEEYYINVDTITNYTAYDSNDLNVIFGDKLAEALKLISRNVYRLIYSYYRGAEPYKHQQYMRLKIYDNTQGEVNALMFAMIETVHGAMQSGMDLNAYINNPKDTFPQTAYDELNNGLLLDRSYKIGTDFEIAYTTQEEVDWT